MKSTNIIKTVDSIGRFKLPKELLQTYNIGKNSNLKIYLQNNYIVIEPMNDICIFCNSMENILTFRGKAICKRCFNEISNHSCVS